MVEDFSAPINSFDGQMYGALLRHKRMEVGYRRADQFVGDLRSVGCNVSKAALYRIERGEQEPTVGFFMASNLILFGDMCSSNLAKACVPESWDSPALSDELMRIMKRNGLLDKVLGTGQKAESRADFYEEIMNGLSSYDFEVFPNSQSDEEHLYVTVATGYNHEYEEYEELESFEIKDADDIERAVLSFLKRHDFQLSGIEAEKLVRHAKRRVLPELTEYQQAWNAPA